MAGGENRRIMEMQMDALKDEHGVDVEESKKKHRIPANARNASNEKIAKLFEDAAEYEEELECFKNELEIINENELDNIATALVQKYPDNEGNYAEELDMVLVAGWTHLAEVEKTHSQEQLAFIKTSTLSKVVAGLNTVFPQYDEDFEAEIRGILVKRWEMLVTIKTEHVKEELAEMKLRGMKPDHIRKVYNNYHGIVS